MRQTLRVEDPEPRWTPEALQDLNTRRRNWPLRRWIEWSVESFAPGLVLATSFGPQSIVLMREITRVRPETTIFYLDTGLLFPETHALRDDLQRRLGVSFTRVAAGLSVADQERSLGPRLWARDPDQCCWLRKVLPLRRFLASKQAWITGIRRAHTEERSGAQVVEWDASNGLVKLNPLVHWSVEQIWAYIRKHDLPSNPLHDEGYPSIGCVPCTSPVRAGDDPRSGRWRGSGKTECGIHAPNGRHDDAGSKLLRITPAGGESR